MGSTPHAHARANVKEPHEQGCVAMIGVFIDTFVVLTLNSLIVICTLYTPDGPSSRLHRRDRKCVTTRTWLVRLRRCVWCGSGCEIRGSRSVLLRVLHDPQLEYVR
ncbi:MAG: alanine:cation symporter family protein [Enterocloster sp.]